jgi:hypothetical protein
MGALVSIHRREDLRQARLLAAHLQLKLSAPPGAVTDTVVERLADMLQEERIWRQNEVARARAEIAAACAEMNYEMARIRAVFDAVTTYVSAPQSAPSGAGGSRLRSPGAGAART